MRATVARDSTVGSFRCSIHYCVIIGFRDIYWRLKQSRLVFADEGFDVSTMMRMNVYTVTTILKLTYSHLLLVLVRFAGHEDVMLSVLSC